MFPVITIHNLGTTLTTWLAFESIAPYENQLMFLGWKPNVLPLDESAFMNTNDPDRIELST